MSASTITIQAGKLARVSPDFHITRGLTETHTLTLLNSSGTALSTTGIFSWGMHVAEDFTVSTDLLAATSTITAAQNVLSVTLNAHTQELIDYLDGKKLSPAFATLAGFAGNGDIAMLITFPLTCLNAVYDAESEPLPIEPSEYYTKLQTDALFADIDSTLHIPRDIADLTDNDSLLFDGDYDSLTNKPTIPPDLTGDLAAKEDAANKATDFTVINNTKYPTVKAVKDFVTGITGDIEAVLDELIGGDA